MDHANVFLTRVLVGAICLVAASQSSAVHPIPSNGGLQSTSGARIEPDDIDPSLFFGPPRPYSEDYRLGPEDVLDVRVFELEQFNQTVRVSGDGTIDLPLVGAIAVRGLLPEEASAKLAETLQDKYVQNPQVSIFVREFNSRKISMLGAVRRPGTYPLVGRKSLLQVLADAGGVAEQAGAVLYVLRDSSDGRRARLEVPLRELIRGDPRLDIWLTPGDVVSVPPKEFIRVSVLGAVQQPGIYEILLDDASLLKAIASAEGLSVRAAKNGIEIQRVGDLGDESILKIRLEDILKGLAPDPVLRDGDIIYVRERFF